MRSIRVLFLVAFALSAISALHAQMVSSGITGTVFDEGGKPVPGAAVVARHEPTGTTYNASTNESGRYTIRGMVVGGPYTIRASIDDRQPAERVDVRTVLGSDIDVSLALPSADVVALEAFRVEAVTSELEPTSTGASSMLGTAQIDMQPTISRSFTDLISTNPFVTVRAGQALTALGQNNRFNSITVDGARINDQFGLNASGLQSFNNPFAFEALEQVSVSLSPYDARRSGFTGAAVDVVTRSGTNRLQGSAYVYYSDDGLQGTDVSGTTLGQRTPLEQKTWGFTLGGPIIKDRLFFFANYEKYERETAASNPGFTPDTATLQAVNDRIAQINSAVGYATDVGSFGGSAANVTDDEKRLLKLDWNISANHRLAVRYSDTVGTQPSYGALNGTNFSGGAPLSGAPQIGRTTALSSNFYDVERTEEVWAGQLFSQWTPDLTTEFSYSKTSFDQDSVPRAIFPEVRIYNVAGVDLTGRSITNGVLAMGTENSRHGNVLSVDTDSFSGVANYYWRNFTFAAGFDREESSFYNLFRQSSYGVFGFNGLEAFVNDTPFAYYRTIVQEGFEIADISEFEQTGLFAEAKWDVSQRLAVTLGLRADFVGSPIEPDENERFLAAFGRSNTGTIDGTTTISPRLSFNYALDDERRTQIRGGAGVFLGRAPWVIFSNAYGNTGVGRFTEAQSGASTQTLVSYLQTQFDPENPVGRTDRTGGSSVINFTEDGTRLPTVVRANLAVDHRLPFLDAVATVEYIHTDVLEGLFIDNINLRPTTVGADGRQRFAGSAGSQPLVAGFGNVLRIRNTDYGSSNYLGVGITRPMNKGWAYNVTYTRGRSTEAQALGSSTAGSQWQFNAVFNQNTLEKGRSDFEVRDRIQASVTKEFKYWRDLKTSVTLYYEGRTGSPYSWVYSNDMNTDGFSGNDLIAVPLNRTDSRFDFSGLSDAQVDAYFAALQRMGLDAYAGGHAPRNSDYQPWQNRLDLSIKQEIPTAGNVKVELFADFMNFGAWLSRGFFNYVETLPIPTNNGLVRQFGSATYGADGRIRPNASFDTWGNVTLPSNSVISVNNNESRWRIQFGARLSF